MQVEQSEINGFLIDQFNQYSLEVGKTQGICPLCSHDRQPKNQKAKCSSYDWERGLGTCHNCNSTFQLHTYQRKGASDREYVRPEITKYLPITITLNDELDQFGNQGPVVVEQTKEEREAKAPKTYLGNVKVVWTNGENVDTPPRDGAPAPQAAPAAQPEADLPF